MTFNEARQVIDEYNECGDMDILFDRQGELLLLYSEVMYYNEYEGLNSSDRKVINFIREFFRDVIDEFGANAQNFGGDEDDGYDPDDWF